jgi:hypothetical protein
VVELSANMSLTWRRGCSWLRHLRLDGAGIGSRDDLGSDIPSCTELAHALSLKALVPSGVLLTESSIW